jgi:hypothetical protein
MLSYILSALSLARHAVALTLVTAAAATTMVAGSADQTGTQPQHETAPMTSEAPTTKPEPTAKFDVTLSQTAKTATPEMSSRPEAKTNEIPFTPKTEPKTERQKPSANLEELVKDCLIKYAAARASTTAGTEGSAASEACRHAIEASALTPTEFWARYAPKTEPKSETPKPTADPEALAKYCIAKYTAAMDNAAARTTAAEVCRRAIEASGLSATEFWTKFGKPQAPKTEPKPTAAPNATELTQLTKYCLTMHAALTTTSSHEQIERTTTVCNQAIAEAKLTPAQFWTKFSASR